MLGWRESTLATFPGDVLNAHGVVVVAFNSASRPRSSESRIALERLAREHGSLARFVAIDADEAADVCRRFGVGPGAIVLFQDGFSVHRMSDADVALMLERHLRVRPDECTDGSCALPPDR